MFPPLVGMLAWNIDILITNARQNVSASRLNLDMERTLGSFSDFWTDSKRPQPETGWGAVIYTSSRFLVVACWWVGLAVAVTLRHVPVGHGWNRCQKIDT